ncbi:TraR/DksA family transcriptional regulator [Sphingomicrobium sediminis]|uniref:TraR/DksA C4-type zinc finger protein n=1 Tax=Sphingomicrobium sediminis TaxID=2950949 RepID=A0A9X2EEE8_9SPHN|nr:TraR/DksA C4-type zinc finger protein [Sphingomicrobium sediminis]MCM8556413.1 TraR/DksA C4-type zinc finger protein [Sphingomicrobium sediminis]
MTKEEARKALLERRAALIEEDRLDEDGRKPVTLDQESVGRLSRMDAMQVQAMAKALEQRRAAERARIDAALKRIDEGEWGYCAECGEEIAEKRLAHDPSVTHCIGCAR